MPWALKKLCAFGGCGLCDSIKGIDVPGAVLTSRAMSPGTAG